jgi:hypothetical protein
MNRAALTLSVTPAQAGAQSRKEQRPASLGPGLRRDDEVAISLEGVRGVTTARLTRHAELVSASILPQARTARAEKWTLNQVQGDEGGLLEGSVG